MNIKSWMPEQTNTTQDPAISSFPNDKFTLIQDNVKINSIETLQNGDILPDTKSCEWVDGWGNIYTQHVVSESVITCHETIVKSRHLPAYSILCPQTTARVPF